MLARELMPCPSLQVQCSQRALALEEIEQLNEKMKGQLRDQSESGIQLGKNLVKYELKNENAKLRLKAAAAELSIHKADKSISPT